MITLRSRLGRAVLVSAAAALAVGSLAACSSSTSSGGTSSDSLEKNSVSIGLTGVGSVSNVPLYLAQSLGYFKDEGLTVNLTALQGGTTAIQSLITNTVDATTNEYVHTISVQQQKKAIESIAVFAQAPNYALTLTKGNFDKTAADLPNMNIGVVSLGGSTEDLVSYVFETNGLDPAKAKLIATGAGASQTVAATSGQVQALIATEPTLTTELDSGNLKPLFDFRDPAVVKKVFGGEAPFWSLLVTPQFAKDNPKTTQALVTGCVRALEYLHSKDVASVVDHLPADVFYPSGDEKLFTEILDGAKAGISTDGSMPSDGPQRIADYLKVAEPDTDFSGIDLSATFTDKFTANAGK